MHVPPAGCSTPLLCGCFASARLLQAPCCRVVSVGVYAHHSGEDDLPNTHVRHSLEGHSCPAHMCMWFGCAPGAKHAVHAVGCSWFQTPPLCHASCHLGPRLLPARGDVRVWCEHDRPLGVAPHCVRHRAAARSRCCQH
jgi:hypothetical protein